MAQPGNRTGRVGAISVTAENQQMFELQPGDRASKDERYIKAAEQAELSYLARQQSRQGLAYSKTVKV
jgi:hypothetical protein